MRVICAKFGKESAYTYIHCSSHFQVRTLRHREGKPQPKVMWPLPRALYMLGFRHLHRCGDNCFGRELEGGDSHCLKSTSI